MYSPSFGFISVSGSALAACAGAAADAEFAVGSAGFEQAVTPTQTDKATEVAHARCVNQDMDFIATPNDGRFYNKMEQARLHAPLAWYAVAKNTATPHIPCEHPTNLRSSASTLFCRALNSTEQHCNFSTAVRGTGSPR
jgi:hypothetical protein